MGDFVKSHYEGLLAFDLNSQVRKRKTREIETTTAFNSGRKRMDGAKLALTQQIKERRLGEGTTGDSLSEHQLC